jgi:ankyrin repeat protein
VKYLIRLMWVGMLAVLMIVGALGQTPDKALHKAAREGDLARLKSLLAGGADPNRRDGNGNSPLLEAVAAGQAAAARALVAAGANPNLASSGGRTPLIEAALGGQIEIARLLIAAGADLNIAERGAGTPLEAAEREGHTEMAALLRRSGARTSGRSVGDKVCVRPWKGDGYCGTVLAIDRNDYRLLVTEIVGCSNGCRAMEECSAGRPVGGSGGLKAGDTITAASSCLTHTGVSK